MAYRIAYYAHHHGSGHLQHAQDIVDTTDHEVIVLSSKKFESSALNASSIVLPSDVVENYQFPTSRPYHYTPVSTAIQARFAALHDALSNFKPDVVIVDVSVEVASFVKLAGYPVIYRHMHGNRLDNPHQNVYAIADGIVAHYDSSLNSEPSLKPFLDKVTFTKMLRPNIASHSDPAPKTVTVLTSSGAEGIAIADVCFAATQTPDWQWTVIGKMDTTNISTLPSNCRYMGFVNNPDDYLSSSSVIVTSGGHNAVARTLAHERPFIVTPEQRPFDEQVSFAKTLEAVYSIPCVVSWQTQNWSQLLDSTLREQTPHKTTTQLLATPEEYGTSVTLAVTKALQP